MASGYNREDGQGGQRLVVPLRSVESFVASLVGDCAPAPAVVLRPSTAIGAIAAADVYAPGASPSADVALIDGYALSSADLVGASAMSPVFLLAEPVSVEAGEPLPPDCDCVVDEDLVVGAKPMIEAQGSAAPGDGVRRAGEDAQAGDLLLRAGQFVTPLAACALELAGVGEIVARRPRVTVVAVPDRSGETSSARVIAALARADGADATLVRAGGRDPHSIARAVSSSVCEAVLIVGGSGAGSSDHAIEALREGRVIAHGVALEPGRSAGAGFMGGVPVLCLPGRFDGALGAYLALAHPLLRRLSGLSGPPLAQAGALTRKIASSVGLSQIALLESNAGGWSPLAVGAITLSHLLRADAWMIVSQMSEGLPEGALITPDILPGRSAWS